MLSGDNSILQKATDAKTNTDNSQIQERINLAYHSALTSGLGKIDEATLKDEIKKEFNKTDSELTEENWLDKTSVTGKWRITIDEVYLDVPAGKQDDQDSRKVTIKTISTNTNLKTAPDLSNYYGQTTDYTSVEGIQWQLFFDDDGYIYLIASDYVPGNTLPSELLTDGEYTTYCGHFLTSWDDTTSPIPAGEIWKEASLATTVQNNPYLKWVGSSVDNKSNKNINMKAVAFMMDTNKWSNFAGSAKGATAIGGPTIEMFALSYNAKHSTNQMGTYSTIINASTDSTNGNANQYGYMIKTGSESWTSSTNLDASSDDLWIIKDFTKAWGYWLSSPSAESEKMTHAAQSAMGSDVISNVFVDNAGYGFRPVISIPKSSLK